MRKLPEKIKFRGATYVQASKVKYQDDTKLIDGMVSRLSEAIRNFEELGRFLRSGVESDASSYWKAMELNDAAFKSVGRINDAMSLLRGMEKRLLDRWTRLEDQQRLDEDMEDYARRHDLGD